MDVKYKVILIMVTNNLINKSVHSEINTHPIVQLIIGKSSLIYNSELM
eukprot:CAMPEP_0116929834 /NCGR_PEP_ID=MMETSP0467-20121206/26821_1 /TAXON_ID=283647 /ORGANISM="Mesodinium pulex, Strain SPMC105" /LENGTH=47 /DNA_ID= /DNA_START= /DNA_END= /DNA_ORIENTATION=